MSSNTPPKASLPDLPTEIIVSIANKLRSERDISNLSRTNHYLNYVVSSVLYHNNVLHQESYALFEGAITDNVNTISKSLFFGRANINTIWTTSNPRLHSARLLRHKPTLWETDTHPKASQIRTGYIRIAEHKLSPLGFAVIYDSFAAASYLLGRGADPSPGLLHLAVHMGHADIVELLLTHNAYHVTCDGGGPVAHGVPNRPDLYNNRAATYRNESAGNGFHVLQLALDGAYLDVARVLILHSPDKEKLRQEPSPSKVKRILCSLVQADQERFESLVSLLVSNGVDIHKWRGDQYDDYGQAKNDTLLTVAAAAKDVKKLLFLVTAGLVTAEEERLEALSPEHIHNAAVRSDIEMLEYLLVHYGDAGMDLPTTTGMFAGGGGRGMATVLESVLRGPHGSNETSEERRKRLPRVPDAVRLILGHKKEKYILLNLPTSVEDDERDRRERMPLAFHLWYSSHGPAVDTEVEKRDWWCARTTKAMLDAGAEIDEMVTTQMREIWCTGCREMLLAHSSIQGGPYQASSQPSGEREDATHVVAQARDEQPVEQLPGDPARDMFVQALMADMAASFLQHLQHRSRR